MATSALVLALRRQREHTTDLGEGKKVTFLRPPETEMTKMLHGDGDTRTWVVGIAEVRQCVVAWEGFTEADFTPAGASDPVPFGAELWAIWVEDNRRDLATVAQAVIDAVIAHETTRAGIEKN